MALLLSYCSQLSFTSLPSLIVLLLFFCLLFELGEEGVGVGVGTLFLYRMHKTPAYLLDRSLKSLSGVARNPAAPLLPDQQLV